MKKTTDYLADLAAFVRSNGGTGTDYSVAKLLNVGTSRVCNYRNGRARMDDALAIRTAHILGISPAEILANCHAERSKDADVRRVWIDIARKSARAVA